MSDAVYTQARSRLRSAFDGCDWRDDVGEAYESSMIPKMIRAVDSMSETAAEVELFIKKAEAELKKKFYTMNSAATLSAIRASMGSSQDYFDSAMAAGGGIGGQRVHLVGAGKEYHRISGSERDASGNFVVDGPVEGSTPGEIAENYQLVPENDASRIDTVTTTRPTIVSESQVAPQSEWAEKAGYTARKGSKQTFIPNRDHDGAVHAGILKPKK